MSLQLYKWSDGYERSVAVRAGNDVTRLSEHGQPGVSLIVHTGEPPGCGVLLRLLRCREISVCEPNLTVEGDHVTLSAPAQLFPLFVTEEIRVGSIRFQLSPVFLTVVDFLSEKEVPMDGKPFARRLAQGLDVDAG